MKIGIVGGSIAGCSAAILLRREGHDISIFERSDKTLVGRGGGIGTTPSLIDQLKKEEMLTKDFAYFEINKMPLIGKSDKHEPYGKTGWALPISFYVFQWNELWKNLRRKVPDDHYRAGTEISKASMNKAGKVELFTSDKKKEVFDLVLFADGYNSLGRNIMFPKVKLKYRGYILWRGLLPESEIPEADRLQNSILRLSYINEPGHNVVYFIPDQKGSVKPGTRIFNWAAYIAVPENELNTLMTDKNGKVRSGTLPPGSMDKKIETKLKSFLSKHTPRYYADIVNKTKDSYLQIIYTQDLDSYYKDKMCLIGDAGMVIQPFTGSGVFKGYNNVKDLISSMNEHQHMDKALEHWNEKQLLNGKRLLALGEQMEKAFIWQQLDFARFDEAALKRWWKASVTFPENFTYQK